MSYSNEPLLEVQGLKKHFPLQGGILSRTTGKVYAVDGIGFSICAGETIGLVGESGCGKTTAARCILALEEPTEGKVLFRGRNIFGMSRNELKKFRSKVQVVFQDPYASLNPRWSVVDIVAEPMVVNTEISRAKIRPNVLNLLSKVGLSEDHLDRFPHEFSGGQRQRIGIARALSIDPELIVLDEPTSSLDVSVQAQILNLLGMLQRELRLAYIFISHNLNVIKHMSTRIAVMYLGKIVELAPADELFQKPLHPYTRALLASIPIPDPKMKHRERRIAGDLPSPAKPPSGCRFHTRCPIAVDKCSTFEPKLVEYSLGHYAACHLAMR